MDDKKKTVLFGAEAHTLRSFVERASSLDLVDDDPDVVVCFGGDGTLLSAELRWPGVPKLPIRNSRRGNRCISHPPEQVIGRLAKNDLVSTRYVKLECDLHYSDSSEPLCCLTAMNEFNIHMGRINAAVRFKILIDGEQHHEADELIGDGFVVCTPFGSTAYFNQITRGVFHTGLGVAFKCVAEHTDHVVVPDNAEIRALITRGPAVLAFDNSTDYFDLNEGDELRFCKHPHAATLLTWAPMKYPTDDF